MPIPKPGKDEPQDAFMHRCMSNSAMMHEYPEQKRRTAVCMDSYRDTKKSKEYEMQWYKLLKVWNGKAIGERVQLAESDAKSLIADGTLEVSATDPFAEAIQESTKAQVEALKGAVTEIVKGMSAETTKNFALITGMRDRVQDDPTGGWPTLGHMAKDVKDLCNRGQAIVTEHMKAWMGKAPTSYQNESTGTDGGVLVPPEYSTTIWTRANAVLDLLGRCDIYNPSGNKLVFPRDTDTDLSGGSGIKVYWDNEAAQYTQSKASFDNMEVALHKMTVLAGVTDELMADGGGALGQWLTNKAGAKIGYKTGQSLIRGNGVGKPLGFLSSAALISVGAETGQAADTLMAENFVNMYARMIPESLGNSIWLAHPMCQKELPKLHLKIGTGGSLVYMPPGGLTGSPYGNIFGRPVILTELMSALGDVGDIAFVDAKQYCAAVKSGGIKASTSIHFWFDYDVTAFKFSLRIGGQPWWKAVYQPPTEGATQPETLSPFIAIAAR